MGTRVSATMWRSLVVLGLLPLMSTMVVAQTRRATDSVDVTATVDTTANASKLIQSVTFSPIVAFAGADLRVVVRVQPDAGNRRLHMIVDAPSFYASTERQLDGVDGARAHTFNVQELPPGDYQIVATLEGVGGIRSRVTRNFKVMGGDDMPPEPTPRPVGRRRGRS